MFNSKSINRFRQANLFESVSHDPGSALKKAMSCAAHDSGYSREQIVDRMNDFCEQAGIKCNGRSQNVTITILEKWLAPGAVGHNIPVRLLPIFCRSCNSNLPLNIYVGFFTDTYIIDAEEKKMLEWARRQLKIRELRKESRLLEGDLGL